MMPFVPDEFEPPRALDTDAFHLEPLGERHSASDFDAWSSSIEHIRATPGFEGRDWPHEMTLEENTRDCRMHAEHFAAREGFTYTVLAPGTDTVIGCVYIYPEPDGEADALVRSWVRAQDASLDGPLRAAVRAWLDDVWPFARVRYADERGAAPEGRP